MPTRKFNKINLLPQEILDQRRFELWYPWIISAAIIVALLIGLFYVGSLIGLKSRREEVQSIQSEITSTKKQSDLLAHFEKEKKDYDAREKVVKEALQDRLDPYLCGLAVTYYLPTTVSVESMTFNATDGMSIQGVVEDATTNPRTKDWRGVAEAIDSLEKSPLLRNIWLTEGTLNDTYANYETNNTKIPITNEHNFPDVVDQFKLSGDLKLTLNPAEKTLWTSKDAQQGGQK